jgi:hypothetical protein
MRKKNNLHIETKYFLWLRNMVHMTNYNHRCYSDLSRILHSKDFTWYVPNDDNREMDGKLLRRRFAQVMSYEEEEIEEILSGPCSMLEMLIALASRLDFIMSKGNEEHVAEWFWEMLANIGLDKFTNDYLSFEDKLYQIDNILYILLERKYLRNGQGGGLFPLKHASKDQRTVELWDQMNTYSLERAEY